VGFLMQRQFGRRQFLWALSGLGYGMISLPASAAGEPIAVVMGSRSGQRGLSIDKLRRIFLALPTDDDDGHRFVPINLGQGSPFRQRFDRSILQMSPEEAARFWIDQRLRGNKPPRSASSLDLARRAVEEKPGAITYLPLSSVGSLRTIAIDGRKPGDGGYGLR
jgi:hypothetical protein